jgi:hypothetical protein
MLCVQGIWPTGSDGTDVNGDNSSFDCLYSADNLCSKVCVGRMVELSLPLPMTSERLLLFESLCFPPKYRHCGVSQVKLFKWPCVAKAAACRQYCGHSSHVHSVRFTKSDQYLVPAIHSHVLSCCSCGLILACKVSIGGADMSMMQVSPPPPHTHTRARASVVYRRICERSGGMFHSWTTKRMLLHFIEYWLRVELIGGSISIKPLMNFTINIAGG